MSHKGFYKGLKSQVPAKRRALGVELLEDRRMLAAQPSVTLTAPSEVMIGEAFQISAAFDNVDAADEGYGPFVDLYIPVNGADGALGVGVDGLSIGASAYLGASVNMTLLTFPNDGGGLGSVLHPYAVDTSGNPLTVTGSTGDQLAVLQLPFGSFTADQPAAVVSIVMQMSDDADLSQILNLRARAGFQFGNDPLGNPASDPSLVSDGAAATSWSEVAPVEPVLIQLEKIYVGPEDETATGPNFPRQYTIEIDVADGQTIANLDVSDVLPNNLQLVSVDAILPSGSTTTNPTTPANSPASTLVATIPTVTGTTATNDASVTFTFFVPFRDADGLQVNSAVSGDDAISQNQARAVGDWDPLDARDAAGVDNAVADPAGVEHTLTPKSIAVQKSVAIVADPDANGLSPGDTLEYTVDFQVSDYFVFQNIVLDDVISDGQRFDAGFIPELQFTEHGATTSGDLNVASYTVTDHYSGAGAPVAPIDGTQDIVFRISQELVLRTGDGVALGGLVPVGGTTGTDPDDASFDAGPTTGVLTFRTIVLEDFSDAFPSGDSSVDEGDELVNDIVVTGDVLSYVDLSPTGESEADTSAASIAILSQPLLKSIYAINGSTTLPSPLLLSPGDEITYRLQLSLPTSDVEDLTLDDYLPLPVLLAGEVTTFDDVISAAAPLAGRAKFGPSDTFRPIFGATPALDVDPVSNRVSLVYGDFDIVGGVASTIDVLFTVTASDEPFTDGLLLTNQARRSQDTTNAGQFVSDAIVPIVLGMPELLITKGIVATDNVNATFTQSPGPVGFSAPGSPGFRAAGTIDSQGLAASPIDADMRLLDAGDLVTFAVVVENQGSSRAGAFDVQLRDTIPAGFAIPGAGLNLRISDGVGDVIAHFELGAGLFDPTGGVLLSDPGPTTPQGDGTDGGAVDVYDATSGRNVVMITYDLQVEDTAIPNQSLTNTATLTHYAGSEGGPDFTTVDLTDSANARVAPLEVSKTVIDTNHANTNGNDVAIGEIATYRSVITVPEGEAGAAMWVDVPNAGLSVIDVLSVTPSSADLTVNPGTFADVQSAAVISANGDSITLNFPSLANANRDDAVLETITVEYRVVVLNRSGNDRGAALTNSATVTWSNGSDGASAPDLAVVEPTLSVAKSIVPAGGQATDLFTVTLDLAHAAASDADAFDVVLTDALPAGLAFVGGLANTAGEVPTSLSESSGTITATFDELLEGETSQIEFTVQLLPSVAPGQVITNVAASSWTSLPGAVASSSSDSLSAERTGSAADPGGTQNDYVASANGTVSVTVPTLVKSITDTNRAYSPGNNVVIGEIVTYLATLTVPQSTLPNARFVDTPTPGLAIVDVVSVTASPSIVSSNGSMAAVASAAVIPADGSSLTLDFGTLANSDADSNVDETILVEYRAVVLNALANDRGDALDNQATFSWGASNSVATSAPDLTILEPELVVTVSDASPATADAGDVVAFTINVAHSGASDVDAFDVTLQNLIDSVANHLQYVPGTLSVAPAGGAVVTAQSDAGGDLDVAWSLFPQGATTTLTFDVRLQNTAPPSTSLTNSAAIAWTTIPDPLSTPQASNPLSVERTGSGSDPGAAANDHNATDSGVVQTSLPQAVKAVSSTSLARTDSSQHNPVLHDLLIGESVTFSVSTTLPEGTTTLNIVDQLPTAAGGVLELIDVQLGTVGANLSILPGAPVVTRTDQDGDLLDDRAALDFGTVLNTPDGAVTTADQLEILVTARLVDAPTNVNGAVLTNVATISFGAGQVIASTDVEVVEPLLQIDKVSSPSTGPAGSTVDYTLVVDHAAGSTSDAFLTTVADLLADPNVALVPGTVATTAGTVVTGNGASDATIEVNIGDLAIGSSVTITFAGVINPDLASGIVINNTSNLAWNNLTDGSGRTGADADPATFTTTAPQVDLQLTKTESPDPVTVDDPLHYTLSVTNAGPSTATGVTIVDTLPAIAIDAVTPSQGTFNLVGNTLTVDIGILRPDETATVVIDATAPATPQTLNNNATVGSNEAELNNLDNAASAPTEVEPPATLSGFNWVDIDGNGVLDPGDTPLASVELTLTGVDYLGNAVSQTTTSLVDGSYAFTGLRPGDYLVTQTQPSLFADSAEYVGSAGGATSGSNALAVALAAGDDATDYNFTEAGLATSTLSKRLLLLSSLQNNGSPTATALDAAFAQLVARGLGDLDGDNDVDADDFTFLQNNLGRVFG